MYLAGLRIPDDDVRNLIELVDQPTRSLLEKSLAFETGVVALTIEDRERILWAHDDARTDALAELRAVLLNEHEGRVRNGRRTANIDRDGALTPMATSDPACRLRDRMLPLDQEVGVRIPAPQPLEPAGTAGVVFPDGDKGSNEAPPASPGAPPGSATRPRRPTGRHSRAYASTVMDFCPRMDLRAPSRTRTVPSRRSRAMSLSSLATCGSRSRSSRRAGLHTPVAARAATGEGQ